MSKNVFYFSLTHKKKLTRKKGLRRKGKREHSRQFYTMFTYKNFILLEYSRHYQITHSLTIKRMATLLLLRSQHIIFLDSKNQEIFIFSFSKITLMFSFNYFKK